MCCRTVGSSAPSPGNCSITFPSSALLSFLQDLKFVGMMQYDGDLLLPANYLVPPPEIHKTSGEFLVHNGISTFACSETQKFGHVTFFWNGNRSGYFDSNLETYLEVSRGLQSCLWVLCVCRLLVVSVCLNWSLQVVPIYATLAGQMVG
jgi:hypothetical protein